jgi:hypothetical protein
VNTQGYAGRTLVQAIAVLTNAPDQREVRLEIRGVVNPFVRMEPGILRFQGMQGSPVEARLRLTPDPAYPFTVTGIRAEKGEDFHFTLTFDDTQGAYLLIGENIRKEPGRYLDTLVLDIESPVRKEIRIRVLGDIRPVAESPS